MAIRNRANQSSAPASDEKVSKPLKLAYTTINGIKALKEAFLEGVDSYRMTTEEKEWALAKKDILVAKARGKVVGMYMFTPGKMKAPSFGFNTKVVDAVVLEHLKALKVGGKTSQPTESEEPKAKAKPLKVRMEAKLVRGEEVKEFVADLSADDFTSAKPLNNSKVKDHIATNGWFEVCISSKTGKTVGIYMVKGVISKSKPAPLYKDCIPVPSMEQASSTHKALESLLTTGTEQPEVTAKPKPSAKAPVGTGEDFKEFHDLGDGFKADQILTLEGAKEAGAAVNNYVMQKTPYLRANFDNHTWYALRNKKGVIVNVLKKNNDTGKVMQQGSDDRSQFAKYTDILSAKLVKSPISVKPSAAQPKPAASTKPSIKPVEVEVEDERTMEELTARIAAMEKTIARLLKAAK